MSTPTPHPPTFPRRLRVQRVGASRAQHEAGGASQRPKIQTLSSRDASNQGLMMFKKIR